MSSDHDDASLAPSCVLRKIDRRLIPLLFTTYMLSFMDKTILSSASVFGLIEDTHLVGQQYSWVSSIFYFGFLLWQWPTNFLIPRVRVAKYLALDTLIWGAVVALTAACTTYGGLLAVRFFLGVAEATITPAFMFITTSWYTRDEIPIRTGIWFSGNSIGGLVASLLAYAIGHIDHPLRPWMWMFIILGVATFLWGFAILTLLPDSISDAAFLTEEEKTVATRRVVIEGTGHTEGTVWHPEQAVECFRDPKTWHLLGVAALTQVPNGGIQNFANLVIKSFGFTALESTLINIPVSLLSGATVTLTGWIAGRTRNLNSILIACVLTVSGVGSTLVYARVYHVSLGVQLLGYFLLATGPGALPLTMSLAQTNYKGVTKKMTITGSMFVAYCIGNIAGPHLFRASEAPGYETSFRTILICYALAAGLALSLHIYLQRLNARRDREEGVHGDAGLSGAVHGQQQNTQGSTEVSPLIRSTVHGQDDSDELTDWGTFGFRYRY
ncbi:major facilitator superfamily domain-containing protein [Aspergillus karnatakaensis]|uniref:major facilitator superfamily domain-containing protein n=1 Tax=Aspergillus karnatakaensis TaxID=1810916 RepID=UPI003CCE0C5F